MNDNEGEIYCLRVQLANEQLIIPRSCVAEVIAWQTPAEFFQAPGWCLGNILWEGRQVPLVSFEALRGEPLPQHSGRARIVLLHTVSPQLQAGAVAILAQGFPQLVRASADLLRTDPTRRFDDTDLVICQVRLLDDSSLVPDLARLEARLVDGLPRQPNAG
jgi:chemosensory pili system protein ChpC